MKQSIYLIKSLLITLLLFVGGSAWGQGLTTTNLTGSLYNNGGTDPTLNTATNTVYGDGNVNYNNYADLINYKVLEIVVNEGTPRLLFNRASGEGNGGDFLEINAKTHSYVTAQGSTWRIDLEKIRLNDTGHNVHLNAIKASPGLTINIKSLKLYSYPANSLSESQFNNSPMDNHFGTEVADGGTIYGLPNSAIDQNYYADLSGYSKMVIAYKGNIPRLVFNDPNRVEINSGNYANYATISDGLMTIDLAKIRANNGGLSNLNSMKAWGGSTTFYSGRLYTEAEWGSLLFPTLTKGSPANTQEEELVIPANSQFTISAAYFKALLGSYPGYLRFTAYNSENEQIEILNVSSQYNESNWYSFDAEGYAYKGGYSGILWDGADPVVVTLPSGTTKLECYALTSSHYWSGNCVEPNDGWLITYTPPAPDTFESSLKTGGQKSLYLKDYVETETTSAEVDFSRALELVSGTPKYARFILIKGGKAVDPTGVLTISGATPAPQQTSKPKQGYYLYNSGNALSTNGITVTLNGTDYADYRVVCLLSTDAAAAATDNVVETEPQWDVQYTYSFTKVITLPYSHMGNPYVQLNYHQMVLDYFGRTEDEMKDRWHADWSVRDKNSRGIQTLRKGNTQGDDVWSAYVGYWWAQYHDGNEYGATLNQNYIYAGHGTAEANSKDKLVAVQNMLGYLQLYAPSAYATMQGASDYEIVYQVTDEYINTWMPVMNM